MNRKALIDKLELVGRALANLAPIYQSFTFTDGKVLAYNDAMAIVAPCKTPESFAVNGNILLGLLRNNTSEEVELKLNGHDLQIKAGKSNCKLPFLDEEAFLFVEPDDEWSEPLSISPSLIDGIKACLMTVCDDESKRALLGIAVRQDNKKMSLYSCDGDALTKFSMKAKSALTDCLLPTSFCETLVKIADEIGLDGSTIVTSEGWVKAYVNSGYIIYGRLQKIDTPFDYESIIKRTLKGKEICVPVPDDLNEALSRARVVADPESGKTILTVEKGVLNLLTETPSGVVRDSVPMDEHSDVQAMVSAELMQKMLVLSAEMSILENCCVFRNGEQLFQLLSNVGN